MDERNLYPFQLVDVRLFEAEIKRLENSNSPEEDIEESNLYLSKKIAIDAEQKQVSVFVNVKIKGPLGKTPGFVIDFVLEGLFEAQKDFSEIEEKYWKEFENTSSLSLIWPYIREYSQNFNFRMREDLPILPTLNTLPIKGESSIEAE